MDNFFDILISLNFLLIAAYLSVAHTQHTRVTQVTENLQVGLGMQSGSSSPPGSKHSHTHTHTEKILPRYPLSRPEQPQLQAQLLFSLQTTCSLVCQLCLFVKMSAVYGPSRSEPPPVPRAEDRIQVHEFDTRRLCLLPEVFCFFKSSMYCKKRRLH